MIYYMNNIIDFKSKSEASKTYSAEVKQLTKLGYDIDTVLIKYLSEGCVPAEVAIILSHRLSELLINIKKPDSLRVMEVAFNVIEDRVNNNA